MGISIDDLSLLDVSFIDTLNNVVSISDTKLINGMGWTSEGHTISATTNIPFLVCLRGVKTITIVFEHFGEASSSGSS